MRAPLYTYSMGLMIFVFLRNRKAFSVQLVRNRTPILRSGRCHKLRTSRSSQPADRTGAMTIAMLARRHGRRVDGKPSCRYLRSCFCSLKG